MQGAETRGSGGGCEVRCERGEVAHATDPRWDRGAVGSGVGRRMHDTYLSMSSRMMPVVGDIWRRYLNTQYLNSTSMVTGTVATKSETNVSDSSQP